MSYFSHYISTLASFIAGGSILICGFDKYGISQPTQSVKNINLVSSEIEDGNTIEVDGLQFKTVISDREIIEDVPSISSKNTFQVPKTNKINNQAVLYVALQITNKTNKPVRLARFGEITFTLTRSDGKRIRAETWGSGSDPVQFGSALVNPGKSINLPVQGSFYWHEDHLLLGFFYCASTCPTYFKDITPGIYQLQLSYSNDRDEIDARTAQAAGTSPKIQRVVWKGEVSVPNIQVRLVK